MANGFGKVALLGLGVSTQAAGEYLLGLPQGSCDGVTVYAGACSDAARERARVLADLGAEVVFDTQDVEGPFDLCVASPGIPATGDFFKSAESACSEVVSDPELAWRESPRDWVAVTGTNGKTTTTTLACELLRSSGIEASTVGNIGLPPIARVADRKLGEVFVAELSSFQLHATKRFAPRAAVLLNVTPDHIEWHGDLESYAADKERVFANMTPRDLCLVGPDEVCAQVAARCAARSLRVAVLGAEPSPCALDAAWVDADGRLRVRLGGRDHGLCRVDEMRLAGPHNVLNALAAAALALEMGARTEAVREALASFAPLAHRVEPCGEVGGVRFYDDSKGTNTDAVLKAVASFEPGRTVVLLGGHDKGTDLEGFSASIARACKAAVAYGEAGDRFAAALEATGPAREGAFAVLRAPHMAEALDAACAAACPGDVVLLSPACSSFDEFSGYKERGEVFQRLVAERAARAGEAVGR